MHIFIAFLKDGIPIKIITAVTAIVIIPLVWPFSGKRPT